MFLSSLEDLLAEKMKGRLTQSLLGALRGGKRLRPKLVYASALCFGVDPRTIMHFAAALECIHAYSLVHDDLPALDNDRYRRGEPSCWAAFGEAKAILTGDFLLTTAFQILSESHLPASIVVLLTQKLARAGIGMIEGQCRDLEGMRDVETMQLKTSLLFGMACEGPACVAGVLRDVQKKAHDFGALYGVVYQMCDDLEDHEGDADQLKKDIRTHIVSLRQNAWSESSFRPFIDDLESFLCR